MAKPKNIREGEVIVEVIDDESSSAGADSIGSSLPKTFTGIIKTDDESDGERVTVERGESTVEIVKKAGWGTLIALGVLGVIFVASAAGNIKQGSDNSILSGENDQLTNQNGQLSTENAQLNGKYAELQGKSNEDCFKSLKSYHGFTATGYQSAYAAAERGEVKSTSAFVSEVKSNSELAKQYGEELLTRLGVDKPQIKATATRTAAATISNTNDLELTADNVTFLASDALTNYANCGNLVAVAEVNQLNITLDQHLAYAEQAADDAARYELDALNAYDSALKAAEAGNFDLAREYLSQTEKARDNAKAAAQAAREHADAAATAENDYENDNVVSSEQAKAAAQAAADAETSAQNAESDYAQAESTINEAEANRFVGLNAEQVSSVRDIILRGHKDIEITGFRTYELDGTKLSLYFNADNSQSPNWDDEVIVETTVDMEKVGFTSEEVIKALNSKAITSREYVCGYILPDWSSKQMEVTLSSGEEEKVLPSRVYVSVDTKYDEKKDVTEISGKIKVFTDEEIISKDITKTSREGRIKKDAAIEEVMNKFYEENKSQSSQSSESTIAVTDKNGQTVRLKIKDIEAE